MSVRSCGFMLERGSSQWGSLASLKRLREVGHISLSSQAPVLSRFPLQRLSLAAYSSIPFTILSSSKLAEIYLFKSGKWLLYNLAFFSNFIVCSIKLMLLFLSKLPFQEMLPSFKILALKIEKTLLFSFKANNWAINFKTLNMRIDFFVIQQCLASLMTEC